MSKKETEISKTMKQIQAEINKSLTVIAKDIEKDGKKLKEAFITSLTPLGLLFKESFDFLSTNEETKAAFDEFSKGASTAFESIYPSLQPLFETALPMALELLNKIATPIIKNIDVLQPVINDLLPQLYSLIDLLISSLSNTMDNIMPILIKVIHEVIPPILQIVEKLLPPLFNILNALMPIFNTAIDLLLPILDLVFTLLDPIIDIINQALVPLLNITMQIINYAIIPMKNQIAMLKDIFSEVFEEISSTVISRFEKVKAVFQNIIDFVKNVFAGNWKDALESLKNAFTNIWDGICEAVKTPFRIVAKAINAIIKEINKFKLPDWDILGPLKGKGISIPIMIPEFASGGFPSMGQMFIAREAGPELVGTIGSRTAVANNYQIEEGIARAVTRAMNQASLGGNWIIQLVDEGGIKSETIISAAERRNRRDGRTIIPLGV